MLTNLLLFFFLMVVTSPWLFRYIASKPRTIKFAFSLCSLLIIFWIMTATFLAPYFQGKPRCSSISYEFSANAELIRQVVILPGAYMALLLPIWMVFLVSGFLPLSTYNIGTKATIVLVLTSAILVVIGVLIYVDIYCHYIGGCNFSSVTHC